MTFVLLPADLALMRSCLAVHLLVADQRVLRFESLSTFPTAVLSVVGVDISSMFF